MFCAAAQGVNRPDRMDEHEHNGERAGDGVQWISRARILRGDARHQQRAGRIAAQAKPEDDNMAHGQRTGTAFAKDTGSVEYQCQRDKKNSCKQQG